ncbi:MAG: hypothetical protein IJJ77_09545 [Paludibacteraceae bacterium]|nr:hypothetical protein [Paludibacteraceae bacterium]
MRKLFIIKEHPFVFVVASIALLTVFLLIFLRPTHSHSHSAVFISEDNVDRSLPDYKVREIQSGEWNKGVWIESTDAGVAIGNTLLISSSDTIVISGWAVDIDRKCPASEIYMEINDKFIKGVYGIPRPDVRKQLGLKCSSEVGFYFYFDRRLLVNEEGMTSVIKFHLIDMEKSMVISSVPFSLIFQSSISDKPTRAIKSEEWLKGLVLDYCGGGVILPEKRQVQSVTNEAVIHIAGWAVDIDHKLPLKSLYLAVNGDIYKIGYGFSRPDVKEAVGISQSDGLGFDVYLPRSLFQNADGTLCDHIEFYLEDKEGYVCEPIRYDWVNN